MKKLQALFCALLVCTLLLSGLPRTASAAYPDRPVTIIIPFGPGGAVDIAARILAEYFQNKHQITLNIVCKAGGAGAPAMLDVAKARPDGYTFGFPAIATFSTTPQIKKTGYTLADFRAVVQVTNMWLSLAVNADSGIKTINELMAAAKATPGKYNYATHGALSTQRLFMSRLLKAFPGVDLPHVSYTSGHRVPEDRILTMQNLVKEALADPDVQAKFAKAGLTTDYLSAEDFQKALDNMWKTIGDIMRENKFN